MKRLIFVLLSVVSTIMAIACDTEYVEQAHRQGKILITVAAAVAFFVMDNWIVEPIGEKNSFPFKLLWAHDRTQPCCHRSG